MGKSKENCIDGGASEIKSGQFGVGNAKNKGEPVWTLKNVMNEAKQAREEKLKEALYAEPSIFKEVNESVYSNRSEQKSQ